MKKTMSGLSAAAAALLLAGSAGAQVCAGFPTTDGQGTIGALATFPTDFDQYGAEGSYNLAGPFAVNAGYLYSGNDDEHLNTFRGGAALDFSFPGNFRSTASICPTVRADYTSRDGLTFWQVPVGVGVGASVPVGSPGMKVTLYIIPAIVWSHAHAEIGNGFEDYDNTETNLGVRGGVELNFDRFYLGATSEWVDGPSPFNGQKEAVVGVRAGIRF
ncbi:MAG: hypothetical protein ACJ8GN_11760 [Longimicrobiaceae bacterium]